MLHEIPESDLGAAGEAMTRAIGACVHCGFCLPACPTYAVLEDERDSPRGRIFLMKEALEGRLEASETAGPIDRCLGCLACEPACPSGVSYRDLITPYRSWLDARRKRPFLARVVRGLAHATLPFPRRMRLAAWSAPVLRGLRSFLPARLRGLVEWLPDGLPARSSLVQTTSARGKRRARVAVHPGCAQSVLAPEIHRAAVEVLARNGVEVETLTDAGCCGALAHHAGLERRARSFARGVLRAVRFCGEVDAILSSAAGCGSGLSEYGALFRGEREESEAREVGERFRDVSVFLETLGLREPPALSRPLRVVYHDACHLAHAQGVRGAPRRLLANVNGLTLLEPRDAHLCCGSAGTYNLEEPELARELGERKVDSLLKTEPDLIATGNIGCLVQLRTLLAGRPDRVPVVHTFEVLARAYDEGDAPTA